MHSVILVKISKMLVTGAAVESPPVVMEMSRSGDFLLSVKNWRTALQGAAQFAQSAFLPRPTCSRACSAYISQTLRSHVWFPLHKITKSPEIPYIRNRKVGDNLVRLLPTQLVCAMVDMHRGGRSCVPSNCWYQDRIPRINLLLHHHHRCANHPRGYQRVTRSSVVIKLKPA